MIEVSFSIDKNEVFNEVAKLTAYVGANREGDTPVYDRVATMEENTEILDDFFEECKSSVCGALMPDLKEVTEDDSSVSFVVSVSDRFVREATEKIRSWLLYFFVYSIVAKWFLIVNKDEAELYETSAKANLVAAREMLVYKRAPQRPKY